MYAQLRHVPNFLSALRVGLAVAVPICFLSGEAVWGFFLALFGCATDYVDGALARRWSWESELGKVLDPMADKALCWGIFTVIFYASPVSVCYVIPATGILFYDLLVVGLRYCGHVTAASKTAKRKTLTLLSGQTLALTAVTWPSFFPPLEILSLRVPPLEILAIPVLFMTLWFAMKSAKVYVAPLRV